MNSIHLPLIVPNTFNYPLCLAPHSPIRHFRKETWYLRSVPYFKCPKCFSIKPSTLCIRMVAECLTKYNWSFQDISGFFISCLPTASKCFQDSFMHFWVTSMACYQFSGGKFLSIFNHQLSHFVEHPPMFMPTCLRKDNWALDPSKTPAGPPRPVRMTLILPIPSSSLCFLLSRMRVSVVSFSTILTKLKLQDVGLSWAATLLQGHLQS